MNEKGQIEIAFIIVVLVICAVVILGVLGEHTANTLLNDSVDAISVTSFEAVTVDDVEAEEAAQEIEELGGYSALPLTVDAQTHHAGQSWYAEKIAIFYDHRGCTPRIDICEEYDFEVHWCEMGDKKAVGLIIGHTIRQVITGYMARTNYWAGKCP